MKTQRLKEDCKLCHTSLLWSMRDRMHDKYFETFNFYFAKPITEILANVPIDHVILFKDLLFFNDDNEYLKRVYSTEEMPARLKILSDFYASQSKLRPNLCKVNAHKIMDKRVQKHYKLMQKGPPAAQQQVVQQMIPDRIFSENYIESQSESIPMNNQISWDSHSHNIYEDATQVLPVLPLPLMPLNSSAEHHKLYNCDADPELELAFNDLNMQTSRLLSTRAPPSNHSQRFKKNDSNRKPKAIVPPLKLPQDKDSATKSKSTSIQGLMKKYDQILQKRFQAKEILTERNEPRPKKPISDELLIKIYKQHLESMKKKKPSENYQFHSSYKSNGIVVQVPAQSCTFEKENDKKKKFSNKVYLPKPIIRKPPSQMSSPSTTNLQNTCSPSMLLRSLSNPSMAPSPARKLEIKVNLNKLIQQQDEQVGYWTQRNKVR